MKYPESPSLDMQCACIWLNFRKLNIKESMRMEVHQVEPEWLFSRCPNQMRYGKTRGARSTLRIYQRVFILSVLITLLWTSVTSHVPALSSSAVQSIALIVGMVVVSRLSCVVHIQTQKGEKNHGSSSCVCSSVRMS